MLENQLPLEKIEVLFDIHQKKVLAELSAVKTELSRVKEELHELRKVRQDTPARAPVAAPAESPAAQFQPTPVEAPAAQPAEVQVDPTVSIDKIFYVGGK
ncbi:MAG: hypothetical protein OXR66_01760 [Candidatus Woesearchaeota archaeon]|nr:hypothetical protein [Candidatus Woesearchaeota archaeon]